VKTWLLEINKMAEWKGVSSNASRDAEYSQADTTVDNLGWGIGQTWFGSAAFAWTEAGLCWLEPNPAAACTDRITTLWAPRSLFRDDAYAATLAGAMQKSGQPCALHLRGTEFQLGVWRQLLTVEAGRTISYGQLAEQAGLGHQSARAVAGAVAANSVAVTVPCHRVLPANGGIGGFRWGSALKKALLTREGIPMAKFDRRAA
jgi:AraC family transcriptional regulator of adaptative response/methylated-DNA-[protein]-cysteine methyltransferase